MTAVSGWTFYHSRIDETAVGFLKIGTLSYGVKIQTGLTIQNSNYHHHHHHYYYYSWTVWESNPGGGEIFRTRPDWPRGRPSLLYTEQRVTFPGVKRMKSGVDNQPPSSAEVKERVELYLGAFMACYRVNIFTLSSSSSSSSSVLFL